MHSVIGRNVPLDFIRTQRNGALDVVLFVVDGALTMFARALRRRSIEPVERAPVRGAHSRASRRTREVLQASFNKSRGDVRVWRIVMRAKNGAGFSL